MPSKIMPSFSYSISVEGNPENLKNIKNRFINEGCQVSSESGDAFALVGSSNNFQMALHPFSNDLKIEGMAKNGNINVTVTRVGERNFSVYLLLFVVAISLASFVQNQQLKMLLFPIFALLGIYIYSFLPSHPAHQKIRKLLRHIDEP